MMLIKIQKEIEHLITESSRGPRYCCAAQQKVLNRDFHLFILSNPFCYLVYFLLFLFGFFPDNFHVLPLKFTKHLDMYNPDIPEWREDIGRVVTRLLAKVFFQIGPKMFPHQS